MKKLQNVVSFFSKFGLITFALCSVLWLGGLQNALAGESKTMAYFFHGTRQCPTCIKIGKVSHEVIMQTFEDRLKTGSLEFREIDVDKPENQHFRQDFSLFTSSVVLVQEKDGSVLRYKNLARVWELIRNETTFRKYIEDETAAFLTAKPQ